MKPRDGRPSVFDTISSSDWKFPSMRDRLLSNWSVPQLLEVLQGYTRCDDGVDLLAFRLSGVVPHRCVYVYLYGDNPDLIHFDLEDRSAGAEELDYTVRRGAVQTREELRTVVRLWLGVVHPAGPGEE